MKTLRTSKLDWKDFKKVEMRVGTIVEAALFEEAHQPAYKLKIDFGSFGMRRSSAQLTGLYTAQELIGRQIVAVLNFPPKQIATMMSECLVLAAVDETVGTSLLSTDHQISNGTLIC